MNEFLDLELSLNTPQPQQGLEFYLRRKAPKG